MAKIKLYIYFGLIVFLVLVSLSGCNGEETIKYDNGSYYVGETSFGLRHGQGTLTRADGEVSSGIWVKGEFIRPIFHLAIAGV